MSAKSIIKIVNLQFIPDLVELPLGSEIEIRVLSHSDTALYSSSQRKFLITCSEFESPELYSGDVFKWKFSFPGKFCLSCPLYSWMKCQVFIVAHENPQDPDIFFHKPPVKVQTKNKATQVHGKTQVNKLPSIASSVASEDEVVENVCNDEGISQEIEELFLQVKAECEMDRVGPANFLQEIEEEEVIFETREKVTRTNDVVNVEREEKKGKVVFTTIAMAPAKYFSSFNEKSLEAEKKKEEKMMQLAKIKSKNKANKADKKLRRRMRSDKDFSLNLLKLVGKIKVKKSSLNESKNFESCLNEIKELESELSRVSMSPAMAKRIECFCRDGKKVDLSDEFYLKQVGCIVFGLNVLWWAEDILNVKGTQELNFSSNLNEKLVEKFLYQSKFQLGWEEGFNN